MIDNQCSAHILEITPGYPYRFLTVRRYKLHDGYKGSAVFVPETAELDFAQLFNVLGMPSAVKKQDQGLLSKPRLLGCINVHRLLRLPPPPVRLPADDVADVRSLLVLWLIWLPRCRAWACAFKL